MLWELEPRVLDKCAMRLQAYRLRSTGSEDKNCALRIKTLFLDDNDDDDNENANDNDDNGAGRQTNKSTRSFVPNVIALPYVSVVKYSRYGIM